MRFEEILPEVRDNGRRARRLAWVEQWPEDDIHIDQRILVSHTTRLSRGFKKEDRSWCIWDLSEEDFQAADWELIPEDTEGERLREEMQDHVDALREQGWNVVHITIGWQTWRAMGLTKAANFKIAGINSQAMASQTEPYQFVVAPKGDA